MFFSGCEWISSVTKTATLILQIVFICISFENDLDQDRSTRPNQDTCEISLRIADRHEHVNPESGFRIN